MFETVRKLYVGAVAVFVYSASASQLMVSQLVMLAVLILVLEARPYASPSDNWYASLRAPSTLALFLEERFFSFLAYIRLDPRQLSSPAPFCQALTPHALLPPTPPPQGGRVRAHATHPPAGPGPHPPRGRVGRRRLQRRGPGLRHDRHVRLHVRLRRVDGGLRRLGARSPAHRRGAQRGGRALPGALERIAVARQGRPRRQHLGHGRRGQRKREAPAVRRRRGQVDAPPPLPPSR